MSSKPMFVVLTGPSGSGKSTAIAGVMEHIKPELEVVVPLRLTTRPPRESDNPLEVRSVDADSFHREVFAGRIIIPHKIREKSNGLLLPDEHRRDSGIVYMQALPTSAGVAIKEQYADRFNVVICRLKARKDIVLARLAQRGPKDDAPADEAASRAQITPEGNDWELDAEQSAEAVRDAVLNMIHSCHGVPAAKWPELIARVPGFRAMSTVAAGASARQGKSAMPATQRRDAETA